VGQGCGRSAQRAGDVEVIAGTGSGAQEGFASGNGADQDDVGEGDGGFGQVTSGERDAGAFRESQQAVVKAGHPRDAAAAGAGEGGRQAEGDEGGEGARAHGGQIAEPAGQCTVADRLGPVPVEAEVAAVNIEVGGDGDFFAGPGAQQGAIVADAEHDWAAGAGAAADLPQEFDFLAVD